MKNEKYKILVLSDLKEKSAQALQYAAKLSTEIDANVELFHVENANKVTEAENSLTAMRVITDVCNKTDKKVRNFANPIAEKNNIKIRTTFAVGNVKNEIENRINSSKPDMIVLGERREKKFNLFGDNVTKLINKKYNGVVVVATDENVLDANGNVSLDNLGLKNNIENYTKTAKNKVTA